jgi:hypothetical protein
MSAEENLKLMQTLDDAWNAQDWDTFEQRHKPDTTVSWPGQPPTHGIKDHRAEGVAMFKTFPDNKAGNRPLPGVVRQRRLDVLDRPLHRHDDRPHGCGGWDRDPPDGQVLRGRLLHRGTLGQRPDRRGEPFLRPGRHDVPARPQLGAFDDVAVLVVLGVVADRSATAGACVLAVADLVGRLGYHRFEAA